jgi:catechol 2,3-dioxygenase-like lactoylglutathione lyase family enzyme
MYSSGLTVWYNVKDLERTLAFYTEKLGFKILNHDTSMGQARLTTNTQDCFIGFSEAQTLLPSTTSTTFEVVNLEQAIQDLQGKGVVFNGGIRTIANLVKLAAFNDPDGHDMMLSEKLYCE